MRLGGHASLVGSPAPAASSQDAGVASLEKWGEADTCTCGHCQKIIHIPVGHKFDEVSGGCRICERMICPQCVDRGVCTPWEEAFARMEAREAARRSYGI